MVYNSSGYEKAEMLRYLEGLVDIYLPDLKYLEADLAGKYSHAKDYPEVAMKALEEMVRQVGMPEFDERGMMKKRCDRASSAFAGTCTEFQKGTGIFIWDLW